MSDVMVTKGGATRVAEVEEKLNELWAGLADGENALLRATTLNLVAYGAASDEMINLLAQVSERHPCRAIVIAVADQPGTAITATPTLLRHPAFGREMRTQVSCELITLNIERDALERAAGAVQSLLLSDHPTYLFRQSELSPADPLLKGLADALNAIVIDSAIFASPEDGLRSVQALLEKTGVRAGVYDLNWLRLAAWFLALSQQFDAANDRITLNSANSVEITHHKARGAALLLFGWLGDRLDWRMMGGSQPDEWTARSASGVIVLRLKEVSISDEGVQTVTIHTQSRTYSASFNATDNCIVIQSDGHHAALSSTPRDVSALLGLALDQSGRDSRYESALTLTLALNPGVVGIGQRAGMIVVEDTDALSRIAARELSLVADYSVKRTKRFTLALSGGSTPRALYELLATAPYRDQIPWAQTHIFWGDERDVPIDHPDSNQRMAAESLLSKVPLPPGNIHGLLTGQLNAADAAARYAAEIRAFFKLSDNELPQFDLILLGLGDDGHTASLFPHTAALTARGEGLFIANEVPQLNTTRLTLTMDAINSASNVMFLVAGDKKAHILYDVVRGPYRPDDHPAQRVNPAEGTLTIVTDQAAASILRRAIDAK